MKEEINYVKGIDRAEEKEGVCRQDICAEVAKENSYYWQMLIHNQTLKE